MCEASGGEAGGCHLRMMFDMVGGTVGRDCHVYISYVVWSRYSLGSWPALHSGCTVLTTEY